MPVIMEGTQHYQVASPSSQNPSFPFHVIVSIIIQACTHNRHPLETLLLDLGLGSSDGSGGVGVGEAAAELAVLGRGGLSGADSEPGGGDLGAAGGPAVGVVDAAAGGELGAITGSDALGAGVVGGQGEGRDGDWEKGQVSYVLVVRRMVGGDSQARTAAAVMRTILIVG